MRSKRVWIISELYYPEETSTGYFLTKIAEGLAQQFPVKVLCSQPTYSARGQSAPAEEVRNGVLIHRCWGTTFNKDILPMKLLNLTSITLSIFLNAMLRFSADDLVLVVTNPPTLPFAVALASFFRRAKCILLIHDVYPEVLVAGGITRPGSLLTKTIGWLTKILYGGMSAIVVLGRDMAWLVRRKLGGDGQRMVTIPNWADLDLVRPYPRDHNPILAELGLTGKFVVQCSGNLGRTHGIECLADCAARLESDPAVHFLLIGFGGKKAWLEQRSRELQLSNITILDYRPRADLPHSLNACDIAVIPFVRGMLGVSVPSRMYNIMAAGKPIIAMTDRDSELARVIEEENIGWIIPPGDVEELRRTILAARDNPVLLAEMGHRSRRAAEAKYSVAGAHEAYNKLVKSLRDQTG